MARTRPKISVGWYLPEWMDSLEVNQAQMIERAGWSKTTASLLYNRQQDFNPALVAAAAHALNIEPFELFLPPEEAHHIKRLRQAVEEEHRLRVVAEERREFAAGQPDDDGRLAPRRKAG